MTTTADYMLTSGEWGGPIDVPLPKGWRYENQPDEMPGYRCLVCSDLDYHWVNDKRTAILCDHFTVMALTLEGWSCVPWPESDGNISWSCRSPDEPEDEETLSDALLVVFGGEG